MRNRSVTIAASLALVAVFAACSPVGQRLALAPANMDATPVGFHDIRYWGDDEIKNFSVTNARRIEQVAQASKTDPHLSAKHADFLAISGGGSDGAYGAGLLVGWSKTGKRPEFEIVTGISTGALSAPFAFLGPDYDPQLTAIYTTVSTRDILRSKGALGALLGSSINDNRPLKALVAKYVTPELLDKIAVENGRGRRLLIGTTNLDAQRPVVWDMTAIAASDNPAKLQLFRDVLVASAAIPGVFPPQLFRVAAADGKSYDEMHVDGGTTKQAFLLSPENSFKAADRARKGRRSRSLYVIINGNFTPQPEQTKPATFAIATRSISTLIRSQGMGDVYRMYTQSLRDGVDFHVASIPEDFTEISETSFDQAYMNKLYDRGYELALSGEAWQKTPPGYVQ